MKKIPVDNCFHCPLRKYYDGWGNHCEHGNVNHPKIELISFIPKWCPLPEDI